MDEDPLGLKTLGLIPLVRHLTGDIKTFGC